MVCTDLLCLSPQPDTILHCKTTDMGLMQHVVCLFPPKLSLVPMHLPTEGWPGWVDLGDCNTLGLLMVYLPADVTHPSTNWAVYGRESNSQPDSYKSDALTITPPSHQHVHVLDINIVDSWWSSSTFYGGWCASLRGGTPTTIKRQRTSPGINYAYVKHMHNWVLREWFLSQSVHTVQQWKVDSNRLNTDDAEYYIVVLVVLVSVRAHSTTVKGG